MLKIHILKLFVIFFFSGGIYAQNLSLVASNQVDQDHILHTLKVSDNSTNSINSNDANLFSYPLSKKNQEFISFAENKNGVQRVTFDPATNTFSILSDKNFKIETIINSNIILIDASE